MPRSTTGNSSCRNRAGNDLPELVGGIQAKRWATWAAVASRWLIGGLAAVLLALAIAWVLFVLSGGLARAP